MDDEKSARALRPRFARGTARPRRAATAVAPPRQPHEKTPPTHARRDGISLALRRAGPLASTPRAAVHLLLPRLLSRGLLRAGRIAVRRLWRQLQLARARLVSRQLPDHRIAAKIPSLLRRRF